MFVQVTAKNVGGVFYETQCIYLAVTGGGIIGKCGRLSAHYSLTYLLTYLLTSTCCRTCRVTEYTCYNT